MGKRKYPKVTGSWTYGHIVVPEKLIYIGSSDKHECCLRWQPRGYEKTELYPYIEKHGWDNIEHIVFKDGLTPKQAKQLEDLLITQAKIDGWCINKQGSGWEWKDNPKECRHNYYKTHKEQLDNYSKKYYKTHKEQLDNYSKIYHKNYYQEHKEEIKDKSRLYRKEHSEEINQKEAIYRSKIENKIYKRVSNYNRSHTPILTPLEAKEMYELTGYIPDFIKNNDLK